MALVTHKFKLDLTPGAARQVLYTSQGDIGRPFEADLYWNGSPWTATGTTANIRGKKPDDTVFDYTATVSGTAVTFETTEQMTIISGPVECELVFSNDGDIIASANFVLMVEDSPYNPDALSESDIPTIGDLIEQTIGGDIRDEVDALIEENPELMLQDNSVTTPKLAAGAVTEGKIASNAVTTGKLATGAVTENKISDGAVTRAKLGDNITDFLPLTCETTIFENNGGKTSVSYSIIPAQYVPKLRLANDTINSVEDAGQNAARNRATLHINAGTWNTSTNETDGFIVVDGETLKTTSNPHSTREYIYMTEDGKLHAMSAQSSLATLQAQNPVWACGSFYAIVENGEIVTETMALEHAQMYYPRSFIGQDANGNYIIGSCGGRELNQQGMTMQEIYNFVLSVNFTPFFLFNLDGGGSVSLTYKGVRQNVLVEGENRACANYIVWGLNPAKISDVFSPAPLTDKKIKEIQSQIYNNIPEKVTVNTTTVNLNDYISRGIYYINNTLAQTALNIPIKKAGTLTVSYLLSDDYYLRQTYDTFQNATYTRMYNKGSGSFSEWQKELVQNDVSTYDNLATGTKVTANTDLNGYVKPGVYFSPDGTTSQSLTNCPVTTFFTMTVRAYNGTYNDNGNWNYIIRELYRGSHPEEVYRQSGSSNGSGTWSFSTWYKFTGTAV